jgi:hypothetical protein
MFFPPPGWSALTSLWQPLSLTSDAQSLHRAHHRHRRPDITTARCWNIARGQLGCDVAIWHLPHLLQDRPQGVTSGCRFGIHLADIGVAKLHTTTALTGLPSTIWMAFCVKASACPVSKSGQENCLRSSGHYRRYHSARATDVSIVAWVTSALLSSRIAFAQIAVAWWFSAT